MQVSAPMRIGVQESARAPLRFAVTEDSIAPPDNPMAAHVGSGNVLVVFGEENSKAAGNLRHYEIVLSESLNGTYHIAGRSEFRHSPAMLNNIPLGVDAYIRIRSVSVGGAFSEWVQVKHGEVQPTSVVMTCSAPSGSVIPEGATFACRNAEGDRLIAFSASEQIVFTE